MKRDRSAPAVAMSGHGRPSGRRPTRGPFSCRWKVGPKKSKPSRSRAVGSQDRERFRLSALLRGLGRHPIVLSIGLDSGLAGAQPAALLTKAGARPRSLLRRRLAAVGLPWPAREAALAAGLKLAVLPATIGGLAHVAGLSGLPLSSAVSIIGRPPSSSRRPTCQILRTPPTGVAPFAVTRSERGGSL
jgi:hypothetical protein